MPKPIKKEIIKALESYQQRVADILTKQGVKAHVVGDLKAYKKLAPISIDFSSVQKGAKEFGVKYGALLRNEGATMIHDKKVRWLAESMKDTRSNVSDIITEGVRTGKGTDAIARELRGTLIRDKNYEYKRIARTETGNIQAHAADKRYKEEGVEEVDWLCGQKPCPACAQYCGKRYKINEAPDLLVHPNCTCDKAPVVTRKVRTKIDEKTVETKKKAQIPKKKVAEPKRRPTIKKKEVPSKKLSSKEKIKSEERASADELWKKTDKDGYEHAKVTNSRTEYADGTSNDSVYIRAPKTSYKSAHTHPDFEYHPEWDCPQSGADIASILKDTNCTRLSASSSKRIFVMNRTKNTKYAPENFKMLKDKFTKTSNDIFEKSVKLYKKKVGKVPNKDEAAKIWRESILEMNKKVANDYNLDYMVFKR